MKAYRMWSCQNGKLGALTGYEWQPGVNTADKKPTKKNSHGFYAWSSLRGALLYAEEGDWVVGEINGWGHVVEHGDQGATEGWRFEFARIEAIYNIGPSAELAAVAERYDIVITQLSKADIMTAFRVSRGILRGLFLRDHGFEAVIDDLREDRTYQLPTSVGFAVYGIPIGSRVGFQLAEDDDELIEEIVLIPD